MQEKMIDETASARPLKFKPFFNTASGFNKYNRLHFKGLSVFVQIKRCTWSDWRHFFVSPPQNVHRIVVSWSFEGVTICNIQWKKIQTKAYQEGIFLETNRQISKMHLLKCYSKYLIFFASLLNKTTAVPTAKRKMQSLLNKIWRGRLDVPL